MAQSVQKELLVVGAGISGSLTAALLARNLPHLSVSVWEKARGAGGRMATHTHSASPGHPTLHVDMGAQYISRFQTAGVDADYAELIEGIYSDLLSSQTLVPFHGRIEGDSKVYPVLGNYVSANGLSSVARYFIAQSQAKTYFQHHLSSVAVDDVTGRICCTAEDETQTLFDGLILTMPIPQILKLRGAVVSALGAKVKTELENVRYSSRYALGLFYSDTNSLPECPWSAKYIDNETIRFASWDTTKRASDLTKGRTLLIHTSVPFGIKHLEVDKTRVQDMVLETVKEVIPGLPNPVHSHITRWRYSQVSRPYTGCPGYVVLCKQPLIVATGDGFIGSNFENCVRAASATVTEVSRHCWN